jgi:hypothetical protein
VKRELPSTKVNVLGHKIQLNVVNPIFDIIVADR